MGKRTQGGAREGHTKKNERARKNTTAAYYFRGRLRGARLQGFPDTFKLPQTDSKAYRQLGNSVAVPVVQAIAKNLIEALRGSQG